MRTALLALTLLAASAGLAQAQGVALPQHIGDVDDGLPLGRRPFLRQACEGAYDQYWRDRMIRLTDTEQPDPALDRRMKEAFNSGFALRRAEHPGCTRASRIAEAAAARKGQALAARLSDVTYRLDPREAAAERAAEDQAPLRPGLP